MFNHKGNLQEAIQELKTNDNNAVAFVFEDAKINEGSLGGVVTTIKDNLTTKDAPTQGSSKFLEGFKPSYDATIVERLRKAGVSIVAKTNLDEFGLGGTGQLSAFGPVANPLDKTRLVGGSSSGMAATFTENIGLAIGTDTGDSVRVPASFTGQVGFKPSYGATSRYGLIQYASSLDTPGWETHSVADSIEVAKAVYGRDDKDMTSKVVEKPVNELVKPQSVAMLDVSSVVSETIQAKYDELKSKLESEGIKVNVVSIDESILNLIAVTYGIISYSEVTANLSNLTGISFGKRHGGDGWEEVMTNSRSEGLGWMVKRRLTLGSLFLAAENQTEIFDKAKSMRRVIVEAFDNAIGENDAFIYPATHIAPKIGSKPTDGWLGSLLQTANFAGRPSIVLPFGKEEGMPFGLAVEHKRYNDKKMLSHALYFEELLGGDHE